MSENQPTQVITPPAATAPQRGLALAALILGISATLSAWVPFLGAILGITAVILGILALKRRQPKGLGLTGLILGAFATIASIIVTVMLFALAGNVINEFENMETTDSSESVEEDADFGVEEEADSEEFEEESELSFGDSDSDAIPWDSMQTEDAPLSTSAGTEEDPHQLGSKILGHGFEIVVNSANTDAADEILSLEPENSAPADGKRYVLFHITLNGQTDEPFETKKVALYYDTPNQWYPARTAKVAVPPQPELFAKDQQITGNFSGYVTFVTKDVEGKFLLIEHDSFDEKQYVALD